MTGWAPKRFWQAASAEPCEGGFTVRLDGRAVKTPAKTALVLPSLALAQAIAAEWDAQQGRVRPETMPFTRMANSALVKIPAQFQETVAEVAGFGATDLLCYRAPDPAGLIARQTAAWDPLLAWAASRYDAPLVVTTGVMAVDQPAESLARLRAAVAGFDSFRLMALHDLVAITGSLILGLAVAEGRLSPDQAFDLSRVDEHWQAELWGVDEEAAELEALKRAAMEQAGRFFLLSAA